MCCKQHLSGRQALSAGADAGAAVPLQPGLRRLRQDRLSRRDPQPAPVATTSAWTAIDECGAPAVSIAGGEPLLHRDMPKIVEGLPRAQEVRHPLHQRAAAGQEDRPVQAASQSSPGRSISTATRRCTTSRSARTAPTTRRSRRSSWPRRRASAPSINCTLFNDADPERVAAFFDEMKAMGLDGITVSPGYAYERAPDQEHFLNREQHQEAVPRHPRARQWRQELGVHPVDHCSWISSPATRPTNARPGQCRRAPCSAGRSPATCWAKAMPRPSSELMEDTEWDKYGVGKYEKCADCMVHCGFEGTAVTDIDQASAEGARRRRARREDRRRRWRRTSPLDSQRPAEFVFSDACRARSWPRSGPPSPGPEQRRRQRSSARRRRSASRPVRISAGICCGPRTQRTQHAGQARCRRPASCRRSAAGGSVRSRRSEIDAQRRRTAGHALARDAGGDVGFHVDGHARRSRDAAPPSRSAVAAIASLPAIVPRARSQAGARPADRSSR